MMVYDVVVVMVDLPGCWLAGWLTGLDLFDY